MERSGNFIMERSGNSIVERSGNFILVKIRTRCETLNFVPGKGLETLSLYAGEGFENETVGLKMEIGVDMHEYVIVCQLVDLVASLDSLTVSLADPYSAVSFGRGTCRVGSLY